MIVVSGALVLVALVLLLIGLASPGLALVYASIGVSAVAICTLLLGFLQGRSATRGAESLRDEERGPESLFGPDRTLDGEPADGEDVDGTAERLDGLGAVVGSADRPGTAAHRPGSEGSGAAGLLSDARPGGPADELAPTDPPPDTEPPVEPDEVRLDDVEELHTAVGAVVLVVPGRPRYHLAGCRYLSGRQPEECSPVDARERGFTPCGVCRPDAALVAEYEHRVLRAGSQRASPPAGPDGQPQTDRPAKRRRPVPAPYRGPVVVLSDRGRFHRPDCRYVREADGVQQLTRSQAGRLDYTPCGVCHP